MYGAVGGKVNWGLALGGYGGVGKRTGLRIQLHLDRYSFELEGNERISELAMFSFLALPLRLSGWRWADGLWMTLVPEALGRLALHGGAFGFLAG